MHVIFALAVALLGPLACAPAMANFRADFAVVKGSRDAGMSRLELGGDKMRMDADNVSMLMDAGSGRMTVLVHDRRQYMDVRKIVETASAAMATASAALDSLPPEQRALIEESIGGEVPGMDSAKVDVSMTPTGAHARVGHFNCEVYRTNVNGEHREDVCLANAADAGISGPDQVTLRRAFAEMRTMADKVSSGTIHSSLRSVPLDKFPVRMTRFDDGKIVQVVELKSLTTGGGVSGSDFAIPTGYREAGIGSLLRH